MLHRSTFYCQLLYYLQAADVVQQAEQISPRFKKRQLDLEHPRWMGSLRMERVPFDVIIPAGFVFILPDGVDFSSASKNSQTIVELKKTFKLGGPAV